MLPSVEKDVTVQDSFILPDLKALGFCLLDDIRGNRLIGAQSLPYQGAIEAHGDAETVVETLFATIRPEIKCLQGKVVSAAALADIAMAQGKGGDWSYPVGYASFVTDQRNSGYLRVYVGQCNAPRRRIYSQHMQSILQGSYETLHYFILWLGNGHRSANFIKLWEFPASQIFDEWYQIQSNLLEAIFCKALFTHHGALEPTTPGTDNIDSTCHSYGSNIMTPLLQGRMLPTMMRLRSNAAVVNSPDPQIRHWASFRPAQKKSQPNAILQPLQFRTDFFEVLRVATADEDVYQTFVESLSESTESLSKNTGSLNDPSNKPSV
ncbi:hypothetical protein V8C42DRAFT_292343 [Trichoderma barbatum]